MDHKKDDEDDKVADDSAATTELTCGQIAKRKKLAKVIYYNSPVANEPNEELPKEVEMKQKLQLAPKWQPQGTSPLRRSRVILRAKRNVAGPPEENQELDIEMMDLEDLSSLDHREQQDSTAYHIVLDTNILMQELTLLNHLKEHSLGDHGPPHLVIPWVVMQELDGIKNRTKKSSGQDVFKKALHAVHFLYNLITKGHPRIRGQTTQEAEESGAFLKAECNDDKILQCCLHLSQKVPADKVILLTNDKNLCSKACINHIPTYTHDRFVEKFGLKSFGRTRPLEKVEPLVQQLRPAVEAEMRDAYGDNWLSKMGSPPPWSLEELLVCIDRYWTSVFSYVFPKEDRPGVEVLESGYKRKELAQRLVEATRRQRQQQAVVKKAVKRRLEEVPEEEVQEVLGLFQRVWAAINVVCGTTLDVLQRPHNFQYQRPASLPTREEILNFQTQFFPRLEQLKRFMGRLFNPNATPNFKMLGRSLASFLPDLELGPTQPVPSSAALRTFARNNPQLILNGWNQLRGFYEAIHSSLQDL